MIEIEVLVELYTDINIAKSILNQYKYLGDYKVVDTYYYDPLRRNLQPNQNNKLMECLRIRKKNGNCYITYKKDYYKGDIWSYSDEYETSCEDFDVIKKILDKMGLKELLVIDNTKHTYVVDKYEIVLEEVNNLGNFLEVEFKHENDYIDVEDVKNDIRLFINSLGLHIGNELNSGKPELMLKKLY